ncbi:uracil nucleotide/cysteinyl leukotriene receptor-like [Danio aesculapii]|uniref:uracil nucleotide/cysteinyl leukotriene receptor-like n=1 Tax=Danio aesculapii TaxID=1142201 RepID=UPI0024BF5501|nr:uracil nucleotide/cysteinyl leukotriene receptor-like [Danio aesculapii]
MDNSSVNFTTLQTNYTADSFHLISLACVTSFSFFVGFPTHSYVIWLIVTGKESGLASEFFNLNLSVCEIGICLKSLFVLLSFWFSIFNILQPILTGLVIMGRPLFQCLMCVERYLAVVHPVTFLKYKPLRYRVICCAVSWIITLGSCFVSMFFLNLTYNSLWLFVLQFFLFNSIQLFCLVAVLRALKQSGPGERKKEEHHMKRRAFYLILVVTVSMAIIYVPCIGSGLFVIFTQQYIPYLWFTSVACYVLAGFVQPVLFLGRVGKLPLCFLKPDLRYHRYFDVFDNTSMGWKHRDNWLYTSQGGNARKLTPLLSP